MKTYASRPVQVIQLKRDLLAEAGHFLVINEDGAASTFSPEAWAQVSPLLGQATVPGTVRRRKTASVKKLVATAAAVPAPTPAPTPLPSPVNRTGAVAALKSAGFKPVPFRLNPESGISAQIMRAFGPDSKGDFLRDMISTKVAKIVGGNSMSVRAIMSVLGSQGLLSKRPAPRTLKQNGATPMLWNLTTAGEVIARRLAARAAQG